MKSYNVSIQSACEAGVGDMTVVIIQRVTPKTNPKFDIMLPRRETPLQLAKLGARTRGTSRGPIPTIWFKIGARN